MRFAHQLFDRHAEEIYHYVLAWTGEQAAAVDLTTTVLRTAVARMDQLVEDGDAELEIRLIALVRAAVTRWSALEPPGRRATMAVTEESMPLFDGLGELDDDQREALILCELLGQEPERAARLLGRDRPALQELRDGALEALWRTMNGAPAGQPVATWDRLTVGTALRQAAGGWLSSADEAVLAYVSEQLFGEAPVGVPATAPAHAAAAAAVKAARPGPAAAAPGHAGGEGEAGAGPDPQAPEVAVPAREQLERAGLRERVAALVPPRRGRWGAWGIAAAAAAGLGVIAALTIGGPVIGSSPCGTERSCPPSTTVAGASGNAGEVMPDPTDASGNGPPTTLGPASGLPLGPGRSSSATGAGGRAPTTSRGGTATTAKPPPTTRRATTTTARATTTTAGATTTTAGATTTTTAGP